MSAGPQVARYQAAPSPELRPGSVDVWRLDLTAGQDAYSRARSLLSPDEVVRADRYTVVEARRTFTLARAGLRSVLARYLQTAPAQIAFVYGREGKPALAPGQGQLSFNLSHSRDVALVAVTAAGRIGVDIEYVRPVPDRDAVAETCFSAAELSDYRSLSETQALGGFFNAWTRKEAFIKAVGNGFAIPLKSFSVSLVPHEPPKLRALPEHVPGDGDWSLAVVAEIEGYRAAVALDRPIREVRIQSLSI